MTNEELAKKVLEAAANVCDFWHIAGPNNAVIAAEKIRQLDLSAILEEAKQSTVPPNESLVEIITGCITRHLETDLVPGRVIAAAREIVSKYCSQNADELEQWSKLKDPVTLHRNLLAGIPARLSHEQLVHLLGEHGVAAIKESNQEQPISGAMDDLPDLPPELDEVKGWRPEYLSPCDCYYTAGQMREYARAAISSNMQAPKQDDRDVIDAQKYRWIRDNKLSDTFIAVARDQGKDIDCLIGAAIAKEQKHDN